MKKSFFKVDIKSIVCDLNEKVAKEVAAGRTKGSVYDEIGISHTTFRQLKNRPESWQIRTDVLCLIATWLDVEPGIYFKRI